MSKKSASSRSKKPAASKIAVIDPGGSETDLLATNSVLKPWVERRYKVKNSTPALIREALLLNERAYEVIVRDPSPMKRGFIVLLIILGVVALSQLIGLGLGLLTTPRVDLLADRILQQVMQFSWYTRNAAQDPNFTESFATIYAAGWQVFRLAFGLPSATGTLASMVGLVVSSLLGWLSLGLLAHWLARWFGGEATPYQFYGALGLSYAPLLLLTLELIPGFQIPWLLMFILLFITRYQAIKSTYDLSPGYSLAASVGPYVITILLVITLAVLGIALGLNQIPLLDPLLRWFVL